MIAVYLYIFLAFRKGDLKFSERIVDLGCQVLVVELR